MPTNEPLVKSKSDLRNDLDTLKTMFNLPRLYLRKYFFDVRTKIDLVYTQKILEENDFNQKGIITKTRSAIFRDLYAFEEECMKNTSMYELPMCTKTKIEVLERQLTDLKEMDKIRINELEKIIKQMSVDLKKMLLLNRNFVYSTGSNNNTLIELDISLGVFVKNFKNEFSLSEK